MGGKDVDSLLIENFVLVITSIVFAIFFVVLEAVLADRLAAYCCAQYSDSRLADRMAGYCCARYSDPRLGGRASLRFQEVLFDGDNEREEAIVLPSCELSEEERQGIFIVGEE